MKKRAPSVVLLSGGLDSTVTAAVARRERPRNPLALLHVNYGQKSEARELKAFRKIADFFQVPDLLLLDFSHLKKIGGSSLTDAGKKIPEKHPGAGIPTTYVPFRNANLLAAAVSWAEVIGADRIYIGVNEPDSRHYPDTRAEFIRAFGRAVKLGTKPKTRITLHTPLIRLRKSGIIRLGHQLEAPFHLTWSCYRGGPRPCGRCSSCLIRGRGFQKAGLSDPLSPEKSLVRKKSRALNRKRVQRSVSEIS